MAMGENDGPRRGRRCRDDRVRFPVPFPLSMRWPRFRLRWWLGACLTLLCFPTGAHAHTMIKGADEFFSGLLHPVLTPSHILLVIALGLLASQQPKPISNASVLTFLVA